MRLQLRCRADFEQLIAMALAIYVQVDACHQARRRGVQDVPGRRCQRSQQVDRGLERGERSEDLRLGSLGQIEDDLHASTMCMGREHKSFCEDLSRTLREGSTQNGSGCHTLAHWCYLLGRQAFAVRRQKQWNAVVSMW
jgi:hypothetical protein